MPCGKKPLVKSWDKPRNLRVIQASRYQKNEASVKLHWQNVIKEIELSCQDEQFWETQGKTVRELVGPIIFARLTKIFKLEMAEEPYVPESEPASVVPSEQFYTTGTHQAQGTAGLTTPISFTEFSDQESEQQLEEEEEESAGWSTDSTPNIPSQSRSKSMVFQVSKSNQNVKSFSNLSRTFNKSVQKSFQSRQTSDTSDTVSSDDDIVVHALSVSKPKSKRYADSKVAFNPFFDMLYCNTSETDMIQWKSNYKQKAFQVSASDEYSKKAELLTKKIAFEFFQWWTALGSDEFKSEIRRPVDIEDLFQVWFDEHASRGLVLDPKILPCVLESIAMYVGEPQSACPKALKRQIAWDIQAETSPAHTMAFNSFLPEHLKHIPPRNNTKKLWHGVRIPEDLRSMAAVWEDISHLTSTKAFRKWLQQRSYMPMPPILKDFNTTGDKKQLFVVPSDYMARDETGIEGFSTQDLAIPVSQFSLEIKEVLSRLLND